MLTPLPIRTFDDVASIGYRIKAYSDVYKKTVPFDPAHACLKGKRFTHVRFACSTVRTLWTAHPPKPCTGIGNLSLEPPKDLEILPGEVGPRARLFCRNCWPYWAITQARRDVEPWKSMWNTNGTGIACPRCGDGLKIEWSGFPGVPFSKGYEANNSPTL